MSNNINVNVKLQKLVMAALLCAVGIVIPMISPIKLIIEPASFTLASHVAIFLAMFISPGVAVAVSLGTTAGFFLGGFPLVVVLRAGSQVVFTLIGSIILQKTPGLLQSGVKATLFSFIMALIHAACEVGVVAFYYFGNNLGTSYYSQGFFMSVIVLVGVGTVIHSMIDFGIAVLVWKPLSHTVKIPVSALAQPRSVKPQMD